MTTKQKTCEDRIGKSMARVRAVIERYMADPDLMEDGDEDELPPFNEYGLSVDVVEAGTFEGQRAPYGRYQLCWGGPTKELRFYFNGDIEFWFLDWFDGAHRDVTGEAWARWLGDYFEDIVEGWPTNR